MKISRTQFLHTFVAGLAVMSFGAMSQGASAQDMAKLPYVDTRLTPVERATDLVHRMTLAEKASEMQNN